MSMIEDSAKRARFIGSSKEGTVFELTLVAILLVACGFGFYLAQQCEGPVAVHFNLKGEVTEWASVKMVYKELILTAFIAIFVMLCAYSPKSIHLPMRTRTPRQVALKVRAARVSALILGFLPLTLAVAMTRQQLAPTIVLVIVLVLVLVFFSVWIWRART